MKRSLYLILSLLVFALFTAPAWAQKGGGGKGKGQSAASQGKKDSSHASMADERSNKGGEVKGTERADEVREMNAEEGHQASGKKSEEAKVAKRAKKASKAAKSKKGGKHGSGGEQE
jgi:hypothetical protein